MIWWLWGCTAAPPAPVHQAYVWQRVWTDAVVDAVQASPVGTLRVNAMAVDDQGLARWAVPPERLGTAIPVVRVETSAAPDWPARVGPALAETVAHWRSAGVTVPAVEIDHDCATRRLKGYAEQLGALRRTLPSDVALWHTALPTWTTDGPALARLRASADGSVLQVHAVDDPAQGLFDPDRAEARVRAYAAVSDRPFLVSVPAYGVQVGPQKRVVAEAPTGWSGHRELWVEPAAVARLIGTLEGRRPRAWHGTVWFRLPTVADRRAWPMETLRATIAGHPPATELTYQARATEPGLYQLTALNPGAVPRPVDPTLEVHGDCTVVEGLGRMVSTRQRAAWRISGNSPLLPPGSLHEVGWARCATLPTVRVP